jgi:hypothetical protein
LNSCGKILPFARRSCCAIVLQGLVREMVVRSLLIGLVVRLDLAFVFALEIVATAWMDGVDLPVVSPATRGTRPDLPNSCPCQMGGPPCPVHVFRTENKPFPLLLDRLLPRYAAESDIQI